MNKYLLLAIDEYGSNSDEKCHNRKHQQEQHFSIIIFWSVVVVSISENHLLVRLVNCLWGAAAAPESTLARATEFRYINYAKFVVNFSRLPRSIACH